MLQYKYNKNKFVASERLFIIYGLYYMYFCVPSVDMHFTEDNLYYDHEAWLSIPVFNPFISLRSLQTLLKTEQTQIRQL